MVRKRHREESYALERPDTRLLVSHYETIIASMHAERDEDEIIIASFNAKSDEDEIIIATLRAHLAQRVVNYDQWEFEVIALCNQVRDIHGKYKEQKRVTRCLRREITQLESTNSYLRDKDL
jgi:hypothetical protein